jgi:hypothetical protein
LGVGAGRKYRSERQKHLAAVAEIDDFERAQTIHGFTGADVELPPPQKAAKANDVGDEVAVAGALYRRTCRRSAARTTAS